MAPDTAEPGSTPSLLEYLEQRKEEYRILYKAWRNGTNDCQYAPATWPPGRCLLTTLPAELLLIICRPLYQADLYHLALCCRALANLTLPLLYERDVSRLDYLALRWACTFGVVPTLERTLQCGAPPNHTYGPASTYRCRWDLEATPGPAPARNARPPPRFLDTPLGIAIVANEPGIVRLLLAHGARANDPGRWAVCTTWVSWPIHLAMCGHHLSRLEPSQLGDPKMVRCLLDAGADPNQHTTGSFVVNRTRRQRGSTPLMMAMQPAVPLETVRLLLQRGADPTIGGLQFFSTPAEDIQDWSPLTILLLRSLDDPSSLDMDKLELLLAHGAVHQTSYMFWPGATPVPILYRHWAHPRIVDVLKLFMAHGVDIASWAAASIPPTLSILWWAEEHIRGCRGRTAMLRAVGDVRRISDVLTVMAEATLVAHSAGPTPKSAIIDAVMSRQSGGLNDPKCGQTALRYVCRPLTFEGAVVLIPLFLHYGADINGRDRKGRTALHHASMFGPEDRARQLLGFLGGPRASGLVVDAPDARGWTPLHYACLFSFWNDPPSRVARARLLLDHGADVHAVTDNGWTPLSLAVFTANPDLAGLLLDRGAEARDLFLRPAPGAEPAMAPVGRIIFLQGGSMDRAVRSARLLAAELRELRTCVATLLERRLGVRLPVPAPLLTSPPDRTLPKATRLRPNDNTGRVVLHVVDIFYPFGIASTCRLDPSSEDFDTDVDTMLAELRRLLELEAFVGLVREPPSLDATWKDSAFFE